MTKVEKSLGVFLALALILAAAFGDAGVSYGLDAALLLFVVVFGGRRFIRRKADPPPSFLFLGVGLFLGVLGAFSLCLAHFGLLASKWLAWGKILFNDGLMLSLILGVGTRLIPALMGHQAVPVPKSPGVQTETQNSFFSQVPATLVILAVLLLASFLAPPRWGQIARAGITFFVAVKYWKIHRVPTRWGFLPIGIWLSAWFLVSGLVTAAAVQEQLMNAHHLFYIGGYGLLTMMISTRVTLSHGGNDLNLELKSRSVAVIVGLIFLAAALRLAAGWAPQIADALMLWAAVSWCAGLLFWIIRFGKFWRTSV